LDNSPTSISESIAENNRYVAQMAMTSNVTEQIIGRMENRQERMENKLDQILQLLLQQKEQEVMFLI
jgi:hypothetical protein